MFQQVLGQGLVGPWCFMTASALSIWIFFLRAHWSGFFNCCFWYYCCDFLRCEGCGKMSSSNQSISLIVWYQGVFFFLYFLILLQVFIKQKKLGTSLIVQYTGCGKEGRLVNILIMPSVSFSATVRNVLFSPWISCEIPLWLSFPSLNLLFLWMMSTLGLCLLQDMCLCIVAKSKKYQSQMEGPKSCRTSCSTRCFSF